MRLGEKSSRRAQYRPLDEAAGFKIDEVIAPTAFLVSPRS
jgi:hypothetical protein